MRHIRPSDGDLYTQTGTGDFDDDCNVDCVYKRGNSLDVMISPAFYESLMTDVATINDFTTLVTSGPDRIVTVSSSGLKELDMEPAHLNQNEDGTDAITWIWNSTSVGSSAWNGATLVRSWSRSTDDHYVVGLDSAGTSLLTMRRTVSGGTATWTAGSTISLGSGGVLDLALLDRDGDSLPEVVVMRSASLKMYSPWSGSPSTVVYQSLVVPGQTNTSIARIRHAASATEWLGWMVNLSDGSQKFKTYGRITTGTPVGYGIANQVNVGSVLGVFAMLGGDIDDDNDDDLAVTHRHDWSVVTIRNTGGTSGPPVFLSTSLDTFACDETVTASPSINQARPIIADVDNDGDGDVAMPIVSLDEMWFGRSDTYLFVTGQPELKLEDALIDGVVVAQAGVFLVSSPKTVDFTFVLPAPSSQAPSGPTYLEVAMWSTADLVTTMPVAFFHERRSIDGFSAGDEVAFDNVVFPGVASTFAAAAPGFQRVIFMTAQVIVVPSGQSAPSWAGPGAIVAVQGQDEAQCYNASRTVHANRAWLNDPHQQLSEPFFEVNAAYTCTSCTTFTLGGSIGNGGYVPCFPVPPNHPPRH